MQELISYLVTAKNYAYPEPPKILPYRFDQRKKVEQHWELGYEDDSSNITDILKYTIKAKLLCIISFRILS